jgi:hypothetical protein
MFINLVVLIHTTKKKFKHINKWGKKIQTKYEANQNKKKKHSNLVLKGKKIVYQFPI